MWYCQGCCRGLRLFLLLLELMPVLTQRVHCIVPGALDRHRKRPEQSDYLFCIVASFIRVGKFFFFCFKQFKQNHPLTSYLVHFLHVQLSHLMLGQVVGAKLFVHLIFDAFVEEPLQIFLKTYKTSQCLNLGSKFGKPNKAKKPFKSSVSLLVCCCSAMMCLFSKHFESINWLLPILDEQ